MQLRRGHFLEIVIEETLDALVSRAQVAGQKPVLFPILRDQRRKYVVELPSCRRRHRRASQQRQLEVDIRIQVGIRVQTAPASVWAARVIETRFPARRGGENPSRGMR